MTAAVVLVVVGATFVTSLGGLLADVLWEASLALAALPLLLLAGSIATALVYVTGTDGGGDRSVWARSPDGRWLVVLAVAIAVGAGALLVIGLVRGRRGPHVAGCLVALIAAIVQAVAIVAVATD